MNNEVQTTNGGNSLNAVYSKYYSVFNAVAQNPCCQRIKLYLSYFVYFVMVGSHENWYESNSPEDVLFKAFKNEFSIKQKITLISLVLLQRAIQEDYTYINNKIDQEGKKFQQLINSIQLWNASWYVFNQNIFKGYGGKMQPKDFNNAMTAFHAHWAYHRHEIF